MAYEDFNAGCVELMYVLTCIVLVRVLYNSTE